MTGPVYLALDGEAELTLWEGYGNHARPVARRCEVDPTAWELLTRQVARPRTSEALDQQVLLDLLREHQPCCVRRGAVAGLAELIMQWHRTDHGKASGEVAGAAS